jgi:dCTP diphosphatase
MPTLSEPEASSLSQAGQPAQDLNLLETLIHALQDFQARRNWERYHDPKNLAEALSIEASELLELFLWKTSEESRCLDPQTLASAKEEVADVFIYLLYLCQSLQIDLLAAAFEKLAINETRYPAEQAKGDFRKYRGDWGIEP